MPENNDLYEGQLTSMAVDQKLPGTPFAQLTTQERMFNAALNAGASVAEASRRAGIAASRGAKWRDREDMIAARNHYLEEFQRDVLPNVIFTKDDAHHMYMEAYRNAGNATEQIKATDSLVKLHQLTEPEQREKEREINTSRQLEDLDVDELVKLAGYKLAGLRPEDIAEGEYTDGDA